MNREKAQRVARCAALGIALLAGSGCATTGVANPDDPLESYNRAMFSFNEGLDKALIEPAAQAYDAVTPQFLRSGIGNFFGNLADVWISANNLLQGKLQDGLSDFSRIIMNSTFGVLGIFDVATPLGIPKHDEDFGQTLAVWGVSEGPYFIVPVFGPRTLRDAAALPVDMAAAEFLQLEDIGARNSVTALRMVHARAALLGVDRTLEEGTLDKYSYARDFYLQQRRYKVHDGNPPRERFDEEFLDEAAPDPAPSR